MNDSDIKRRRQRLAAYVLGGGAVAAHSLGAQAATESAGAPTASNGDDTTLEEVIVTAQRRVQRAIDVPYNISAVSGETIEQQHIMDTAELMRSVPGVSVVDRGDRNSSVVSGIRIRGLNVDSSALGDYAVSAAATVATYVNDTPLFANFLLTDIDRVEVLRGPQGTLYGSGALGGAVRYILRQPQLGVSSGSVSGSVSHVDGSSSEGFSGTATLNEPLGENLALRLTATHNNYPGVTDYVNVYKLDGNKTPVAPNGPLSTDETIESRKDADFAHQTYGRAALLWQAGKLDVTFSLMGQKDKFGGRRATTLGENGFGRAYKDSEVGAAELEPSNRTVVLGSLEANLDMGFATLTSSSSYYDHHGDITSDNTGFYAQNGWLGNFYYNYPRPLASAVRTYGDNAFIEEIRLVSAPSDKLEYVVGAYYQNQHLASTQDSYLRGFKQWWDAAYPAFAAAVISDQDYLYRHHEQFREAALFGELTWHLSPTVQATGGVRVFRDRSDTRVHQSTALYSSIAEASDSTGSDSTSKAIWKGNVAWHFAPDNQLYATVAQGYRRGGSNGTPTTGTFAESPAWLAYKADTVINYELGVKGEIGGLTYNANLFMVDWRDPQVNTATTFWGFFAVQNADKARTQGVELQLGGALGTHFHYGLGYTYTDAKLTADAIAADGLYTIATDGTPLPGVPKQTINASFDFTQPIGTGKLTLRADAYHQSETQNTLFSSTTSLNSYPGSPYYLQPKFYYPMDGFAIVNASATWSRESWDATLWIKNVGNEAGVTGVYTPAYMGTAPSENFNGNSSKALIALPRTVGLTLGYRF